MKEDITISEKYSPAMEITDQAEADKYFTELVAHNLKCRRKAGEPFNRAAAESIERQNLGYFAGYYNSETRERVERLFKCCHPIFGPIAKHGQPSPRDALAAGVIASAKGIKFAAKVMQS